MKNQNVFACLFISFIASFSLFAKEEVFIVGSDADHRPFTYETVDQKPAGFDVDLIEAIAQKAGLAIKIIHIPWTDAFAMLDHGDIHILISGIVVNARRSQYYNFTRPYFEGRQVIAVMRESRFEDYRQLAGKRIGVIQNSSGNDLAIRSFMRGPKNTEIRRFSTSSDMLADLLQGRIDAFIIGHSELMVISRDNPKIRALSNANFPKEYLSFATHWGDKALTDKLNLAFDEIIKEGVYEKIYRHWFDTQPPHLPPHLESILQ